MSRRRQAAAPSSSAAAQIAALVAPLERAKRHAHREALRTAYMRRVILLVGGLAILIVAKSGHLLSALGILACGALIAFEHARRSALLERPIAQRWLSQAIDVEGLTPIGRSTLTELLLSPRVTCEQGLMWARAEAKRQR